MRVTALCPGPGCDRIPGPRRPGAAKLPHLLAVRAERVAEEGYRGLMAGRRLVVPGLLNKIVARLAPLVPRALMLEAVNASQRRRGE